RKMRLAVTMKVLTFMFILLSPTSCSAYFSWAGPIRARCFSCVVAFFRFRGRSDVLLQVHRAELARLFPLDVDTANFIPSLLKPKSTQPITCAAESSTLAEVRPCAEWRQMPDPDRITSTAVRLACRQARPMTEQDDCVPSHEDRPPGGRTASS